MLKPRERKVKILATLGPASSSPDMIRALMEAGADAFRINMSHGSQAEKAKLVEAIRALEKANASPDHHPVRPAGSEASGRQVQGWLGRARQRAICSCSTASKEPGDSTRVELPHPELFEAVKKDTRLLIDDGKVRLRIAAVEKDQIAAVVEVGGKVSNNKGVNVPDVLVPIPALTKKDREDLKFALEQGADFIALSFVQRPEDVAEARELVGDRAALLAKIEKPQAIERLDEILELADAVMVARGDLGVELPPEGVPPLQNRIVAAARQAGKPVVVATQMLESMIVSPTPTRAEVSDVANAIYEGADAVMLSAESAAGAFPIEAVAMMDKIGRSVEADPVYSARIHFTETPAEATTADALSESAAQIVEIIEARAMACYTSSGSTARRIARERAQVPTLAMTASMKVARRLGLQWGVHAVHTRDVNNFEEMVGKAKRMVLRHHLAEAGDRVLIMAGVPFKTSGSTNVIHVVKIVGDELETYSTEG